MGLLGRYCVVFMVTGEGERARDTPISEPLQMPKAMKYRDASPRTEPPAALLMTIPKDQSSFPLLPLLPFFPFELIRTQASPQAWP
jgi:hypothetical protein